MSNEEEVDEQEIIRSLEFNDTTGREDRERIRNLMAEGSFDRRTNIALNRMLIKDQILDRYGTSQGYLREFVKGVVLGTQAEARDKLIKLQIRNENLKSVALIVSIIGIIVTAISIILTLSGL